MSGHGNFSAINGVRPTLPTIQQPGEDIGVSLNKSVGGVNAPGASDAGGANDEAPLNETGDAAEKTGAFVRQLDVLLARAAESATKGIDAASLKDTLNQVNLTKGDRKAMNAAADKADAAFKAINKFTGFELAAAVSAKDGKFDWNMTNPAGEAIKKALDDKKGITRYGFASIPMDEALGQCSIDISGRAFLVFDCEFAAAMCGQMDTQLAEEFFRAVAFNSDITLHLSCPYGNNDHHKMEALFKAFARSLREAVAIDPRNADKIPSTKGVL